MNSNHITYYNNFEKNLSDVIRFISNNNKVIDTHFSLYYDKKNNYKLYAKSKELKYYFRIRPQHYMNNYIDVHYKNENDYFIAYSNKNFIIKSKLTFLNFLKEYYFILSYANIASIFEKDIITNFNFNESLLKNIFSIHEIFFKRVLDDILDDSVAYRHIVHNTSINSVELYNIVDNYFINNLSNFNILTDNIKNNISEKVKKEYSHYFNANQFDLI